MFLKLQFSSSGKSWQKAKRRRFPCSEVFYLFSKTFTRVSRILFTTREKGTFSSTTLSKIYHESGQ